MGKWILLFLFYFSIHFFIIYCSSIDPVKNPIYWTPENLYTQLKRTSLNPNNPDYSKNIKYMIYDPEFYLLHSYLNEAYNAMNILYEKYNISTHVFFISHMEAKFKIDEAYANFDNNLSYLIYKDNEMYNEDLTLTAVFFIKDRKMRIRTTKKLRDTLTDNDALDILNRRKNDLKANNFQDVANDLMKDILKTYQYNIENKDNNNNLILFYIILFIIVISIFVSLFNSEKSSEQEDKVKLFLDKLKTRKNPKEIFTESCIICLEDFKTNEEIKKIEDSGNKELFEKEEISVLECGHKFHRKCISDWLKKQQNCPNCRMKFDIKDNNNSNKSSGENININFVNILSEVLRIQVDINRLNEREVHRIRNIYDSNYRSSNNYSFSRTSHNKSFSSHNSGSGGATSGW